MFLEPFEEEKSAEPHQHIAILGDCTTVKILKRERKLAYKLMMMTAFIITLGESM